MRAISTVLDVSFFLLFVGAAAATLVLVPAETQPVAGDPADETAELLATSTTQVNYSIESGLDGERPASDDRLNPAQRTYRDSVANLLGVAAVARAELDDEPLLDHGSAFERRVVTATENRIRRENVSTEVRARWEPYPDAPLSGTVLAGNSPPPAVDVHAATVSVDSGMGNVSERALQNAREDGFDGLADVLARATIDGYLPRAETRLALRGGFPSADNTAARVEHLEQVLLSDSEREGNETAVDRSALESALAERLATDLREGYDDPTAAAADVETEHVTVTVRTWSR